MILRERRLVREISDVPDFSNALQVKEGIPEICLCVFEGQILIKKKKKKILTVRLGTNAM